MQIVVNNHIHLSEFRSSDKDALIAHLNDQDIYDRTLRIPFPYTEKDANEWLALVAKITQQQGCPVNWAIRSADDALIGGCGFEEFGLVKITAHVFTHNPASARVLEKCGFQEEEFLRKHYFKDGKFIDAR